jgi:signal transduction histidine kinase
MLHQFIASNRHEIIRRCTAQVAARSVAAPSEPARAHGVPLFLDQLAEVLRARQVSNPDIARSAIQHGHELLLDGFAASHVVHDYCDVCQAITELAVEMDTSISPDDFQMLNRCLDTAIAGAVSAYGREQNKSAIEEETTRANERAGFVDHEMRNLLNTAILAFEVLKKGNVGVGGSTGAVLQRSLLAARALTSRALAEIRLAQGVQHPEQFLVAPFIEELAQAAAIEGDARGIALRVVPAEDGLIVNADRQVLTAVVINLLQNAFKFTRPGTTVVLRAGASVERVLIEVEDECGGLANGDLDEVFRPFAQHGTDRTGLGLGLAFSRWGVEQNNGQIYARNLPERGCVFTVDLPRIAVEEVASV